MLVTCLKTSTFCYLLPELQLFFRYWEKIPRSQKCGCNPWDRVTQQRLRRCEGKLPGGRGFGEGYCSWTRESQVEKHCLLPPFVSGLEVDCGRMWCLTLKSQNAGTLWRPKVSQRRWADQELWFHWLAVSTPATPWSRLLVMKEETSTVWASQPDFQTEETRLLLHNVHYHTWVPFPLVRLSKLLWLSFRLRLLSLTLLGLPAYPASQSLRSLIWKTVFGLFISIFYSFYSFSRLSQFFPLNWPPLLLF